MAAIDVVEVFIEGSEGDETEIQAEAYEGKVALHIQQRSDEPTGPTASCYLSPIDAAILAERLSASSRQAVADPAYTP